MAVKITGHYTTLKNAKGYVIAFNEKEFLQSYVKEQRQLNEDDYRLMYLIDNAVPVEGVNHIKTPFGETDITHLSTGLKTVLNVRNAIKDRKLPLTVDLTECGPNVLPYIFREVDNQDILCVLRHLDIPDNCDFEFEVGGQIKHGTQGLLSLLRKE